MLTKEHETELLTRIRGGDAQAEAELIEACMPLVHQAAHPRLEGKIKRRQRHGTLSRADAVQEGLVGLMTALRRFDAARGIRFTTFATLCIRNAVRDALRACVRHSRHEIPCSGCMSELRWHAHPANDLDPADAARLGELQRQFLDTQPGRRVHQHRVERLRSCFRAAS